MLAAPTDITIPRTIYITSICVVRHREGADHLIARSNLPSGVWPFDTAATLSTDVARGEAVAYITQHFPGVKTCIVTDERNYRIDWARTPPVLVPDNRKISEGEFVE